MEGAVGLDERGRGHAQDLAHGILLRLGGNACVEAGHGIAQAANEHRVAERVALGGGLAGGDVRAVRDRVAQLLEPGQGRVFELTLA